MVYHFQLVSYSYTQLVSFLPSPTSPTVALEYVGICQRGQRWEGILADKRPIDSHDVVGKKHVLRSLGILLEWPIGSMYGIYANIWGILMVNVTIYNIHGSYGWCLKCLGACSRCSDSHIPLFSWAFIRLQATSIHLGHPTAGAKKRNSQLSVRQRISDHQEHASCMGFHGNGGVARNSLHVPVLFLQSMGKTRVLGCNMNNTQGSQLRQPVGHTQQPYARWGHIAWWFQKVWEAP